MTMIYKNDKKIKRILIDDKEIYRVYFNDKVVFKRYHPVKAIVATTIDQYIATDMKNFWTDEIDYEICFSINYNSSCIFGCRPDKSYQEYAILIENNTSGQFNIRKGGQTVNGTQPCYYKLTGTDTGMTGSVKVNLLNCDRGDNNDLRTYDIVNVHTIKKEGNNVYHNGKKMTMGSGYNDFFLTYLPPYFFKLNQVDFENTEDNTPNSPNANGTRYLYYAKFYKNGKMYRHYVPVLDENENAALYEKVTNKFIYSAGTKSLEYFNGNYGQVSCIYGFSSSAYVDTSILPQNIGKWEMRLQSTTNIVSKTATGGFGSMRSDKTGIYFKIVDDFYTFYIGDQIITTDIPFAIDSEIKIVIDLINKKLTIERNNQQNFASISKKEYGLTFSDNFEDLPTLTIGKINGSSDSLNIRVYQNKIYDTEGALIQRLKPRVELTTKKAVLYDEAIDMAYGTNGISYI